MPEKNAPQLSLVICTYNRDKYLPGTLSTITQQAADKNNFELLIIDNNSTDRTAAIAAKFIADNSAINTSYFFESNKGLSFARNRGIAEAKGSVIVYIDDDVILPENYLSSLMNFFKERPDAAGAGGKVIPKYESGTEPLWMNKYLNGFIGRVDHGDAIKIFDKEMKYPAGCNMIYKKEVLLAAGGFNNDLTFRSDDKYIFQQVKKISGKIYYIPCAWLYHYIDEARLQFSNFKKLFLKTGNEEKKRVVAASGSWGWIKKLAEFKIKFGASLLLFIAFVLKGEYQKGKYTVLSQWYTLIGFLKKEVYVR
ncbi:MAG: glycosyltransferase family A protein [Ferruginibacter sp.]